MLTKLSHFGKLLVLSLVICYLECAKDRDRERADALVENAEPMANGRPVLTQPGTGRVVQQVRHQTMFILIHSPPEHNCPKV